MTMPPPTPRRPADHGHADRNGDRVSLRRILSVDQPFVSLNTIRDVRFDRVFGRDTRAICVSRVVRGATRHDLFFRKRNMDRLYVDDRAQLTLLHELGHAYMNPVRMSPFVIGSHFLTELGATVLGWLRFRYLFPHLKTRRLLRYVAGQWWYYTERVGFGLYEFAAVAFALQWGFMWGAAWSEFPMLPVQRPAWFLFFSACFALFAATYSTIADKRSRPLGHRSFKLNGIW